MWRKKFGRFSIEAAWFPRWSPGHRMLGIGLGTPMYHELRFECALWWCGVAVNFSK